MTKTGPNDASGVVLGPMYVFIFLRVFYILTNDFYFIYVLSVLKVRGRFKLGRAATTKGEFFFLSFVFFRY